MGFNIDLMKRLREHHGLSQAGLSRSSGVPEGTISSIESNRSKDPGYSTVKAISQALGVEHDAFYLPDSLHICSNAATSPDAEA